MTPNLVRVNKYLRLFQDNDKLPVLLVIDKFGDEGNHYVIEPIYQVEDEKEVVLMDGLEFKIVSIKMHSTR